MEWLGVGSGGVLRPFLATSTCVNKGRNVLELLRAFRETRTDAFKFMCEVCLSAAPPRSYFFDSCSLPGATTRSLPASWRDGQPARLLHAASARWTRVGKGGGIPCGIGLKHSGDARTQTCYRKRQMHLHSELLLRSVWGDLRRLTFDLRGGWRA